MIYKNMTFQLLSCDPRACLATGAMGKPQTSKRAPIMKHENQPPPHLPLLSLVSPFLSNTSPVPRRCRFVQLRPGKRREDEVDQRYREEEAGSMMIYKTSSSQFYCPFLQSLPTSTSCSRPTPLPSSSFHPPPLSPSACNSEPIIE